MEHKCKFKLEKTEWQHPSGMAGTSMPVEMAYLMCEICFTVIKKRVE